MPGVVCGNFDLLVLSLDPAMETDSSEFSTFVELTEKTWRDLFLTYFFTHLVLILLPVAYSGNICLQFRDL